MINVTNQLKKESLTNRNYYVTANVTLSNGTTLKLQKKDFYLSGNSLVDSADSNDFPVGVAIEKTATLSLVNDDGRFDGYNFNGARFVIFLNLQLSDRLEIVKRGTYIVSKKPATASTISLSLLDRMHDADKTYDSNLSFPCTVRELLSECCQQCGITLGDATFPNADFQVQQAPSNTTYRTVIGLCAGIAGGNARIDESDLLRVITFDKTFTDSAGTYDGGAVKNWTNGDDLDGGTLNPWTEGTVIDGGTLDENDYHALFSIKNLQYDVDDIIVTGVKYTEDETEYMSGQDGYVITVDNQLLSGNAQAGVDAIGSQLIGLRMRPFSCSGIANGYATFGDPVEFIDTKNRAYRSFATDIEFTFGGSTSWSCNAKSAEEDVSEFIGDQQAAVEQAKKDVEKKMSAYDVKLKQMNELAANTLGFFYTEEAQEDGSVITYRHDKPTLADSMVIYKTGVDGFFLSVDGGKTWKAGFDSNGDAVLNILYAIGIQAEWINTRGLTAKDNSGNITMRVDADTGEITMNVSSFKLQGQSIDDITGEVVSEKISVTEGKIESEVTRATNEESYLSSRITQTANSLSSEITDTKNSLGSRITQTESSLSSKVSAEDIASSINQTAQSVQIDASKINFNGLVTANNSFKILTDGSMQCTGGTIGGFTIGSTSLYTYTSGSYKMEINSSEKKIRVSDGSTTYISHKGTNRNTVVIGGATSTALFGDVDCCAGAFDSISTQSITASTASSFNAITSSSTITATGKLISKSHIESSGHFYNSGSGNDLSDLSVRGTKKRIFDTENYGMQAFYCYEMASPVFGDIGTATISADGTCLIDLDDIFQESANVGITYYVFLQKEGEGDCWVEEKTPTHFIIKGTPELKFSFEIKAMQTNYEHMRFADTSETAYDRAVEELDYDYTAEEVNISEPNYEKELETDRLNAINQLEVAS